MSILETKDIGKQFGDFWALKNVSLTFYSGEVHAILGENGAGKSTLMKIFAGVQSQSAGHFYIDNIEQIYKNPQDALNAGISIIFQELSLFPNLDVASNIFANRELGTQYIIDHKKIYQQTEKILKELNIDLDPKAMVSSLSIGQQQLVEIARALSHDARFIIMDEPTSSLAEKEAELLFSLIERLKQKDIGVIYISHRLDEIMSLPKFISVFRDGRHINTVEKEKTSIPELLKMMVGREISEIYPEPIRPYDPKAAPILKVRELTHIPYYQKIDFHVKKGEILGFFGLVGAGRTEIMKRIFGIHSSEKGEIIFDDMDISKLSTKEIINQGLIYLPESRKDDGLVLSHSIQSNISMGHLDIFSRGFGTINHQKEAKETLEAAKCHNVKFRNIQQKIKDLSGGNQQKSLLARWLLKKPKLLILDEPTRGIDVGARYEIYQKIYKLCAEGTSIILISSDLPEVLALSNRLIIMREGRIAYQTLSQKIDAERVMHYATGGQ